MVVGVLQVTLSLPEAGSLKDKRRVLQGLMERVRRRYNVAVAEVGRQDDRREAVLAVACVSTSRRHADAVLQEVLRWLERETAGLIAHVETQLR